MIRWILIVLAALSLLWAGCTPETVFPTVRYVDQQLENSADQFAKGIESLHADHKLLAPNDEVVAGINANTAAFQDAMRQAILAMKETSTNTVSDANSLLESLFGPLVGAGGMGSVWLALTGRRKEREQGAEKTRREKIDERVNGMFADFGNTLAAAVNGVNDLKHTLALNAPPPVQPSPPPAPTPVPASVATPTASA